MTDYAERLWVPSPSGRRLIDAPRRIRDYLEGLQAELKGLGFLMAGYSNAAELIILDSSFGDGSTNLWTAPTYLALVTSAVGETDTAGSLTEANYTGYARKSLAAADMSAASAGSKTNSAQQTFAACTAGSSTVIGWATTSSSSGAGDVIFFGTCTSTVISTTQTPAQVAVGGLVANLD